MGSIFTGRGKYQLQSQQGITGLETAIILIAFIVVASVFAYTVLTAGVFSSQKANESVNAAIQEVRSSITSTETRSRTRAPSTSTARRARLTVLMPW